MQKNAKSQKGDLVIYQYLAKCSIFCFFEERKERERKKQRERKKERITASPHGKIRLDRQVDD